MRIVAHNGAHLWGGAERATVALLAGLRDRGHDVLLLCNDEVVLRPAREAGIPARISRIGGDVALPHALRLAVELRAIRPDAFIVGTYKKLFLAALGARLAGVPRVVARVGLETDTPRSTKYRVALRRWVDGVVVNAHRISAPFAELDGIGASAVTVIHNGVRRPQCQRPAGAVRQEVGIGDGAFVAGTIARLATQKRIDRLIDAIALLPADVHCLVAGGGEEATRLGRHVREKGVDQRVHFLGHRDDVGDVLSAMDVFVVSSDREGLSNSMLEAMASGVPVVSTRVSGAEDAIAENGDDPAGVLAEFTAESIGDALRMLRADRDRLRAMGESAQHRAETRFSFDLMLDRWEAFLATDGPKN